jgi:hypothetical protein
MRLTYALIILSGALFGSALAVPQQEAPLAEAQFKNIVSFKGSKASDVIPAMEFMSASLGVSCDYCHTQDRASDEKRAKGTAREMIAMQRDINAKNFGGRNQVTCSTCHAGHEHPVAVPPVTGTDVRARRSPDVKTADVLTAYGKAVGGDASHPLGGLKLEGTSMTKGAKSNLDVMYMGNKFVYSTHGGKMDRRMGFNGTMAWFSTPQGIQSVPLTYAESYVNQSTLFAGPDTLPKLDNPAGATANIGGKDMIVVTGAISGEKTRMSLFFDKKTGLLARTQYSYPTILGNIVQINDFADYKKVNGVQLPMTITNHTSEGDTVTHFNSVKSDGSLAASSFDPPAK